MTVRPRTALATALPATLIALMLHGAPASATSAGTITGAAWQDLNRNGLQDSGETPFANRQINVFDSNGAYVANGVTDANGRYSVSGLADGTYLVAWDTTDWQALRQDWVPTTTSSLRFEQTVSLAGSSVANFGLRPIGRSTDISAPLSTFTAPSGLVVRSYDDAVSAHAVYDALTLGSLFGGEAPSTSIYFDYGTQTDCATSVGGGPGSYAGFSASLWIAYLSWLDTGDEVLFHEYGHAWSLYNAYIVQQDGSLASYIQARGLTGDPRIGTSKYWDPKEMIAEDYRQLFGSANAASYTQANTDIPPAAQVPGLRDWMQNTFPSRPAGTGTSGGSSGGGTTTTTLTVTAPTVSPSPVVKSATVTSTVSGAATVTIEIRTAAGALVRTLLNAGSVTAGSVSASWDRKDAAGRRVRTGTYVAVVTAADSTGASAAAQSSFGVS